MKISNRIFALVLLLALVNACQNDDTSSVALTENISIENTKVLEYKLGKFGDEEGAVIVQQPQYFRSSQIVRETDSVYYEFLAEEDFIGALNVVIETMRGSDGTGESNEVHVVNLNITVID